MAHVTVYGDFAVALIVFILLYFIFHQKLSYCVCEYFVLTYSVIFFLKNFKVYGYFLIQKYKYYFQDMNI